MTCSISKILYATATILPGTQQIVGLGKMGYGLYKRYISPFTMGVNDLFNKNIDKKTWPQQKAWSHLKEGAALFIPIIGTIYAIYKLTISPKVPEKKNDVRAPEKNDVKAPEKTDIKGAETKSEKTSPKKQIKKEVPKIIPLIEQPFCAENLIAKFKDLAINCRGKKPKEQHKLTAAFASEIKKTELIENFKAIPVGVEHLLAMTLKKRILEVDLPRLDRKK